MVHDKSLERCTCRNISNLSDPHMTISIWDTSQRNRHCSFTYHVADLLRSHDLFLLDKRPRELCVLLGLAVSAARYVKWPSIHKLWEHYHNDQGDIWRVYLSTSICRINQSWVTPCNYSLHFSCDSQLLMHLWDTLFVRHVMYGSWDRIHVNWQTY